MALRAQLTRWSRRPALLVSGGVVAAVAILLALSGRGTSVAPDIETAEVKLGDFVDTIGFRGEMKALRSVSIVAPSRAGDLQIVTLARNGSLVKQNEVVLQFDTTKVEQTLLEKRTALRQADAEIEKARAQQRLQTESIRTEQLQGAYDVERAKLDVSTRDVISQYDLKKAEVALGDAQQRVHEVDARVGATDAGAHADLAALFHKRDKAKLDVDEAERNLKALTVRAPVEGLFTLQTTWRGNGEGEFREGDKPWSGAIVAEIPDPTHTYVLAKVDETDRGRLATKMSAIVTSDSLPGVEIPAHLSAFSTLARPDYSSWPPPRNFDVMIDLDTPDPRLKPGMTTAVRVAIDKLPNTLLIPSRALIQTDAQSIVYVVTRQGLERRPVTVARRGQKDVAISKGLQAGERVATGESARKLAAAGPAPGRPASSAGLTP
jgi:multidrug efflux pump subunit AcrA (membrane-fusion protein)